MATKKTTAAVRKTAPAKQVKAAEPENLFGDEPVAQEQAQWSVDLKVKRLSKDAVLPVYATPGSACFDIVTTSQSVLAAGRAKVFDTGLAFEVPEGYVLKVYSRSGHGFKNGVRLGNGTGILDSDFRGELKVCLHNDSPDNLKVYKGDRIAQAMLVPIPKVAIVEVQELSDTERGTGGFGSTGR